MKMKAHFKKDEFIDRKGKVWNADNLDELIQTCRDLRRVYDNLEHYFDIDELD